MSIQEQLKKQEQFSPSSEHGEGVEPQLTLEEVDQLCLERSGSLEGLRNFIHLKLYHEVGEKLEKEKKAFKDLLRIQDSAQELLSNYSFVLNPYYFEQRFLE